jgi:acyl-CoA thioesterase I
MRPVYHILALLASILLLAAACGGGAGAPAESDPSTGAAPREAPETRDTKGPLIVFLGDSLTAGLGLPEDEAFPALLGRRLRAEGVSVRVVNAGVSGDTTTGGLSRLSWLLQQNPDVLVVGLGANDALRGQPLDVIVGNLREIIERGRAAGTRVLLLGMRIPTNFGPDYAEGFAALYPRLAKEMKIELVPFLLDGVGGHPNLNQEDGIHPTARGHEILADNVLPHLKRVLEKLQR